MLPPYAILSALWGMPCHSPRRGVLMYDAAPVGSVPVPVEVELRPDSAATINVAGAGFKHVLVLDDGSGGRLQQVVGDRTWACRSVLPVDLPVGVAAGSRPPSLVGGFGEQHVKLAGEPIWSACIFQRRTFCFWKDLSSPL